MGALFSNRESATDAAAELRGVGFTDEELATAEWLEGRYAIASHAQTEMGRSLWIGAIVGTVLGALLGAAALLFFARVWTRVGEYPTGDRPSGRPGPLLASRGPLPPP